MPTRQQALINCLVEAMDHFNANEQYLITRDLSERCVCAKFMSHLERTVASSDFRDYIVDVEYNRGNQGNEYNAKAQDDKKIVVDLIVHKRNYNYGFDNLICIEMKKASLRRQIPEDKDRLCYLTDNTKGFKYEVGAMMVIGKGRKYHDKLLIDALFFNGVEYPYPLAIELNTANTPEIRL